MKTTTLNESAEKNTLLVKRPSAARGTTELGWLHSRHTFSFGNYFDPDHMGFRALRVINDDVVEPGQGFGEHPHRDAEIFSYVLEGELQHKDSMGNDSNSKAGTTRNFCCLISTEENKTQERKLKSYAATDPHGSYFRGRIHSVHCLGFKPEPT